MIGFSHGGKHGDILYGVPLMKRISELTGEKIDFYTSKEYSSTRRLLEHQDYINAVIVPPTYKIDHFGWGVQPWDFRPFVDTSKYTEFYQLGYRAFPDRSLPNWYAHTIGMDNLSVPCLNMFKYPEVKTLDGDYVVMASRRSLDFPNTFKHFIDICPVPIVQIGGIREDWPCREGDISIIQLDWLETVSWISKAKGFIGIISSQGALAHNFDIPKVFPFHDGWDMRHVVQTPTTLYMPVFEKAGYGGTAEDALAFMGLL